MMVAMAKKAKGAEQATLLPEFRRRHLHLVLPKLLTDKAAFSLFDEARLSRPPTG
jgi:hypothetical protein